MLDAEELNSDYKLQDKTFKAVERPLRTMVLKGGCKNAALLIYINKCGNTIFGSPPPSSEGQWWQISCAKRSRLRMTLRVY